MAARRASIKDRQSQVRTKISDEEYDRLERLAELWGMSVYKAARYLIREGLWRNR